MKTVMHTLGKFVWVWTALVSIKSGLRTFGYDSYARYVLEYPTAVKVLCYISLAAGIISLVMLAMACTSSSCCSTCDCKACGPKHHHTM